MTIIKNVSAWDQLETFESDRWDKVGDLVNHILDNNLQTEFDDYISFEFPNGCYESEFEKFCCKESENIIKKI